MQAGNKSTTIRISLPFREFWFKMIQVIMRRYFLFVATFLLIGLGSLRAQSDSATLRRMQPHYATTFGIEQDILPYILRGYIGTGWIGREGVRIRFSYAHATQPKFFLGDGILRDRVQAFGISTEFFVRPGFRGWWFGPGIGYWTDVIDTKLQTNLRHESFIFSLGGGYIFNLRPWLYLSTWTALHTRVSGNAPLDYGGIIYKPALLTPEVSLKIGVKLKAWR